MNIRTRAITQIAMQLRNLKCQFMIVPPEGEPLMEGEFTHHVKSPRAKSGELAAVYRPQIQGMQPGEVRVVNTAPFDADRVRAALSSYLVNIWGAGNSVTQITGSDTIEVLCLATDSDGDNSQPPLL
jgi:hypothetical protein